MCCNFVVEPKVGANDRKFSSSQRTDRELSDEVGRSLPFSEDGEKVLCSLLLSPRDVLDLCQIKLRPEAFYAPAHQNYYIDIFREKYLVRPPVQIAAT
jgi:hypothetical protein